MERNDQLKEKYKSEKKNNEYSNLRLGEFDYSVIAQFLALPAIDVCLNRMEPTAAYTFPAPALNGKYSNTKETIKQNRVRIDYILASPTLARSCQTVTIFNQENTHSLSDHYPMMAEFALSEK